MENPIEKFSSYYAQQLAFSKAQIPSACCFTTVGIDGYPNSRFVSLKGIKDGSFIVTGPLNSRKGTDVNNSPKVSITFWWPETEKQIRIQGLASKIQESVATEYFSKRNKASKVVSIISEQGAKIASYDELLTRFEDAKAVYENSVKINKPKEWLGFYIKPERIEFMEFMKTRLHKRVLYTLNEGAWERSFLQP